MPHSDTTIEFDLFADWTEIMRGALHTLGYAVPTDAAAVERGYFNFLKRAVERRPRTVHVASGLVCPSEHDAGYQALLRKVRDGGDLRPHLSTRLTALDFDDGLLNDWGIHHLHLGTTIDGRGFVNRTGPVLFARFAGADAYLIAIGAHGHGNPGAFADLQLVELLERNWPQLVPTLPGIRGGSNPTSAEIASARAHGVTPLVSVGGKVVFPMGGGISTAGVGVDVVVMMDHAHSAILGFEKALAEHRDEVRERLVARGFVPPVRLRLRVHPDGNAYASTEDGTFGIPLGRVVAPSPYATASWASSRGAPTMRDEPSSQKGRNRRKAQRRARRDAARK